MEFFAQTLDDIVSNFGPLAVEWKDETASRVIGQLRSLPVKKSYGTDDLKSLLDKGFDDAVLIFRLFLGLSKDHLSRS